MAVGGAEVRWSSRNLLSTQKQAAANIAKMALRLFLREWCSLARKFGLCSKQVMTRPRADGRHQLMDVSGGATLLMHKGKELEERNSQQDF